MNAMRVIAKAGDVEVIQDANSTFSISTGGRIWISDQGSAYEAIREGVQDPVTRKELLRQWALSMNQGGRP